MNRIFYKQTSFWTAVSLLYLLGPFYFWPIIHAGGLVLQTLVESIIAFVFYKNSRLSKKDSRLIFLYVITWLLFVTLKMIHGAQLGLIIQIPLLFYVVTFFVNNNFARSTFCYFSTLFSVFILLSLISYFLYLLGVLSPLGIMNHPDDLLGDRVYFHYPFMLIENNPSLLLNRFSGPFDEAGLIGTFGLLIICIENFNFKDWKNVVIIIGGLVSLSLFFYIGFVVTFLYYKTVRQKNYMTLSFFIVVLAAFYLTTKDNEIIKYTVWDRIALDEDTGKIAGDNRMSTDADEYYNKIKKTSEYFWGVSDQEKYWEVAKGGSSYKNVIATNGVIFFALYVSFFILVGYRYKSNNIDFILYMIVLAIVLYQRPGVYAIVAFFFYSCLARSSELLKIDINNIENKRQLHIASIRK